MSLLKTYPGTHVQSQTHYFKFDLSLTKTKYSTKIQKCRNTCTESNSFSEFDLNWTNTQWSTRKQKQTTKNKNTNKGEGTHVQSRTHIFSSLT